MNKNGILQKLYKKKCSPFLSLFFMTDKKVLSMICKSNVF